MDAIERLTAVEDIKRLKAAYFRAMDMKDWDAFRALFVEDCVIDTSEAFTPRDAAGLPIEADLPVVPPNPDLVIHGIDGFIAAQHHHLDGVSTVHHGHMPEIDIVSADEATGIWAMEDKLRWAAGSANPMRAMHGYGHYSERYIRTDGGWRIAELKLTRIRIDVTMA